MDEKKAQTAENKPQTANIFQRMLAISNEIATVPKNLQVSAGKGSYRAVGEADILRAVKELETKWGVYSYPSTREIVEAGQLTKSSNGYETKQFYLRLHVVYRFVNVDDPEEFIEVDSYGDGVDSGDKAPGKAMTYADKYALMKAYKIVTGDDPDQSASEEYSGYERQDRRATAPYRPASQMATEEQKATIRRLYAEKGSPKEKYSFLFDSKVKKTGLTQALAAEIIDWLGRIPSPAPQKKPDEEKAE